MASCQQGVGLVPSDSQMDPVGNPVPSSESLKLDNVSDDKSLATADNTDHDDDANHGQNTEKDIQKDLPANNRQDILDLDNKEPKECLDETVSRLFPLASESEQSLVSYIEEELLWESKQLGVHSPVTLLNTILYFNTRYFGLRSVEDHMQLAFTHLMRHYQNVTSSGTSSPAVGATSSNTEKRIILRFYPPASLLGKNKMRSYYEQFQNKDLPQRCPVKHYEFYLSKCPGLMVPRNNCFYLSPKMSYEADSSEWYTNIPMTRASLEQMFNSFKTVRQIKEAFLEGR